MNLGRRDRTAQGRVIALSVSYQREPLLALGLGLEHLRELVHRLVRPILRRGASLAYGGRWEDAEDNFTYLLLRLISAEQEDSSAGGPDTSRAIGGLVSYSPWPHYLQITRQIEAQWINCCRIVRVTQERAGIPPEHVVRDPEAEQQTDRFLLNGAITRSATRRLAMTGAQLESPDVPPESIEPVAGRIVLGGKVDGFQGFVPGVLEEALITLERGIPLYLLGGFGGITEVMASAFLSAAGGPRPDPLTVEYHHQRTPALARLAELHAKLPVPGIRTTQEMLDAFWIRAQGGPAALATGLSEPEARELLTTRDMSRAVRLVLRGLQARLGVALDAT